MADGYSPEIIKKSIQILAGTYDKDERNLELAEVLSIDTKNFLCDVQLTSGENQGNIIYNGVQLCAEIGADGVIIVPKVGANILIEITTRNQVYMIKPSDIDSMYIIRNNGDGTFHTWQLTSTGIQMEDGSYGGLVRYDTLIQLLTATNNILTAVLAVINNSVISEPGNGSPSALQTALRIALSGMNIGSLQNLANQFITQGKPLNS